MNTTVDALTNSAMQGDVESQYKLAIMLYSGNGVSTDIKMAASWFLKAATKGHIRAQVEIGLMYFNGIGVNKDFNEAVEWLKQAADKAEPYAMYYLGTINIKSATDRNSGLELIRKAADAGCRNALHCLGQLHLKGHLVIKDEIKAFQLIKLAALKGYVEACNSLGYLYYNGIGTTKNRKQGVIWYTKSAERGYRDAQYNLAMSYFLGQGVALDDNKAIEWFLSAARKGDCRAFRIIKKYFPSTPGLTEKGIEGSTLLNDSLFVLAVKHGVNRATFDNDVDLERSAALGERDAQYCLARNSTDKQEALDWYIKAAKQGHADAQFVIAVKIVSGEISSYDLCQAYKWFLEAAQSGKIEAQQWLARCYADGIGTLVNNTEAIKWAKHSRYFLFLEVRYRDDIRIASNDSDAINWWWKLAKAGDLGAKFLLGKVYLYGYNDIVADLSISEMLLTEVADRGLDEAQYLLACVLEYLSCRDDDSYQLRVKAITKWLKRAAAQGHAEALNMLGDYCLSNGKKDYAEAIGHYSAACKQGYNSEERLKELLPPELLSPFDLLTIDLWLNDKTKVDAWTAVLMARDSNRDDHDYYDDQNGDSGGHSDYSSDFEDITSCPDSNRKGGYWMGPDEMGADDDGQDRWCWIPDYDDESDDTEKSDDLGASGSALNGA